MMSRLARASLLENAASALTAMWGQKLRSFLTLLGIMAGVATVILMVSFVAGFNNVITEQFTQFGTQLVQFQKYEPRFGPQGPPEEQRNRRDLTLEDADALKRLVPAAAAVSPERYLFFRTPRVQAGDREANGALVFGAAPDYMQANVHWVSDGRFFTEADLKHAAQVAVIGTDIADALFPFRDPIGEMIRIDGRAFSVIGLFERKGTFFGGSNNGHVAIPITTFDVVYPEVKNSHGDTIHIATVPKSPELHEALIEQGTAVLRARRQLKPNQENDFTVFTSQGQLDNFRQITGGVAAAMIVIAAIALLVGGVGVMNIMLVNVTERTREIGLRKAIGATDGDIATQFLAEAVTLTAVGGALGVAIGIGLALIVKATLDYPVSTPLWSVALGLGVSSAVGLIFGLWPALKAARLDPIEALRYE
jgi:putative ABC transport system permease protein